MYRYGRTETVHLAQRACLWYGSFGNTPGRCVLVREPDSTKAYDLALFTLDQTATPAQIVERYAMRWSIEPANAVGKQQMGVGQARNRVWVPESRRTSCDLLILVDEPAEAVASLDLVDLGCSAAGEWS